MDVNNAVTELARLGRLCLLQVVIMAAVSTLFFTETPIAIVIYDKLGKLEYYLPILWRYQRFFEAGGRINDFPILFSISLANIVIQFLFLAIICFRLSKKINIESAERFIPKTDVLFMILLIASLVPSLEVLVGPQELGTIFLNIVGPPAIAGYVLNCLIVPGGNVLFSFLVVARFGLYDSSRRRH